MSSALLRSAEGPVKRSPVLDLLFTAPKRFAILMLLASLKAASEGLIYKIFSGRGNPKMIERIWENEITIRHFYEDGGITLTDLARLANLSPSTVREHLQELIKDGFVRREGSRKGAKYYVDEEIFYKYIANPDVSHGVLLNMLELYEEYVVARLARILLKVEI